jgi:hypothetical protein
MRMAIDWWRCKGIPLQCHELLSTISTILHNFNRDEGGLADRMCRHCIVLFESTLIAPTPVTLAEVISQINDFLKY